MTSSVIGERWGMRRGWKILIGVVAMLVVAQHEQVRTIQHRQYLI
jgi:hypothetical protein